MQSTNFEFLRQQWPELASLGGFAEHYAHGDPQSAVTKLRNFAERTVNIVYGELSLPKQPMASFMDLLSNSAFVSYQPRPVLDKLHALRIHGNKAAHGDKVTVDNALWLIREAWDIARWLWLTHANGDASKIESFQQPVAPVSEKSKYKQERKALLEQYARQEAQMQALLAELETQKQKTEQLQPSATALEKISNRGTQVADSLKFDEATTRKFLIDTQLASAGWNVGAEVADTDQVHQEVPVQFQTNNQTGTGYADYVLFDDNGKPLAVIEAKKTAVDAEKGRHQAKRYADGLEKVYGQRPVIFYTNGYDIWIWDDHPAAAYPPRRLYGFYSRNSLQHRIRQRAERKPLNSVAPKPDIINDRLYQHEALKRICERFEDKGRKALAVQATGTGKTRLAIALSDVCMKAGWVKRVLFLCDRRELRKQAKNAYDQFLSAPITTVSRRSVDDTSNRIFVATYPSMMKIFENFDPGFFDLIIADESHRSIYNIYGDLFRYFDALQIGLTATPVEMVSRSTCQLFGCDFKLPTSNYPLERAVEEGYLVPYQVVKHTTKFLREGIKGKALTAEQVAELEDQGVDPNMLDFDGPDIDRAIYNKDTNRMILRNLMEQGIRQADGQTLGKSIIFARNHKHAKLLENLFDELYPQYGGKFCQVIDNYDPRAEDLIDDFKGVEGASNKDLTIAISVDMLDTGIDIPELVNLVFARPVKSPVKFWQMVGRGTRLCKDLFGPGKHKTHFQIFDHWGVVEYHGMKVREVTISQSKPLLQRVFELRLQLAEDALQAAEPDFFDQMADWLHKTINALNDRSIAVREKWQLKQQLSQLELIRQFAPNTVTLLKTEIAPLMQWVDIRGHADAYQWDLLLSQIALHKLQQSARFDDYVADAIDWLYSLKMNLNPVKAKAETIKQCREADWWRSASLDELEQVRQSLREIARHREKQGSETSATPVIDVKDSDEVREAQSTYLSAVDMRAYRNKVEKVLEALFADNPVLKKLRAGEAVSQHELDNLNALIHTRNPGVDLNKLKEFYDTAEPLDKILRSIVGLEASFVNQRFADFVQAFPNLSAKQVQFLGMLKRQIAQSGAIQLSKLYEMPFSALGDVDSVFDSDEQIERLLDIVRSFGEQPLEYQATTHD